LMGLHLPQTTSSLPRYAFTVTVFLFGLTLAYHHWHLRRAPLPAAKGVSGKDWGHLVIIGTLGGLVSSLFGSGADLFAYITLTLGFGLSERKAIPTTVLLMAILSIIGSADLVLRNHPTVAEVFPFWLVCVPVVAVGAPMGAWIAAHAARQHLIYGILFLIFLECASTALLLGWPSSPIPLLGFSLLSLGYFLFLLHQRHQLENTPSNRPLVSSES
ncbi:MAG: sulfite exporter TauE/SafE family protein, partial [Verrucomicrobiota bacterium]